MERIGVIVRTLAGLIGGFCVAFALILKFNIVILIIGIALLAYGVRTDCIYRYSKSKGHSSKEEHFVYWAFFDENGGKKYK